MKFPYKAVIIVLVCVCLVLGIYNAYDKVFGRVKKQIAVLGTIEDRIETTGYIMRDELVIADNSGTVIDSLVSDGERVKKGQQVAAIYSASVDPETKAQLKTLNERIINLEKSAMQGKILGNDSVKSEALIKAKVSDIIKYAHKGQGLELSEIKSELETVIDEKLTDDKSESVLETLKNQKRDLEAGITGEKNALYAPEAGMYFSFLDGGENVFPADKIFSMTVKDYKGINDASFDEKVYTGAKIVRDFKWYYVTVIDTKRSMAMKKGMSVNLRFNENSDKETKAHVCYMSKDDGGKTVVAFEVYSYNEYAYSNRSTKVSVIVNSAQGLKFLKDAVRVEDSVTGVYVIDDTVAKFRQVEILGSDDKYVVVKNNITDYKSVALYDEIVVKGDVENNKVVK
ncbi:MAG: hypothetical protein IJE46_05560 [Clostridia bacterium]|nr:hypothetical protein [Clostridia bacterium]